ncbi:protein sorting system archaetidylserine decarboxylase [Natronosalvus vescus]|uniref:protein sorting system archaetidylserine decarboxylase n=1 Tax=Natronosalvus vescus TaxID=2953881 RepID=UPI0020914FD4|nr:protein sorting system archaetidylserine decarboxylase [Natronosalvus vescus]
MKFAPGAWRYALLPLLAAPFAFIFSVTASVVLLVLGAATLGFFRDPERTPPPSGVVAPADGTVSVCREEGTRVRLGTFMNVHNVHVVRAPFDATVHEAEHVPGAHKPAFSKDSDRNERVHLRLEPTTGRASTEPDTTDETNADDDSSPAAEVTFIAGAFARRIFPYVETGESIERGQRIGHIAFGSRVDVVFPPSVSPDDLAIEMGQKMTAGETVILEPDADTGLGMSSLEGETGLEMGGLDDEAVDSNGDGSTEDVAN